ncbi:MAG TPA: tellurite resistance/C4-dicarboxylate transporter family protein [Candidatus Acidoferrum sp.]|nr:tellurite resistance/C4-dicarboxylate transporter family protein [Candidatus Acidoferrum sp.]
MAESVRNLHPAYFALVMATGIVGIAAQLEGISALAKAITWLNAFAFLILCTMTLSRIVFYPAEIAADLIDHKRGVGFFTTVAATAILGTDLVVVYGEHKIALLLWILAALLWVSLTYTIFTAYTVKQQKPAFAEGINGAWLLAVVATESVSQLATLLSPTAGAHQSQILFLSLCLWLCGGMLYIWMISLIFYRYTFFVFSASDLMPPYWINMGAVAISSLAGILLMEHASGVPFLRQMTPFLMGFTLFFWATATWWIPMLVILGVWRHGYKRFKLAYDPLYWGLVFPLGMYTVATRRLSEVINLPFLLPLARVFVVAAAVAWLATFSGLIHRLVEVLSVKKSH